MAQAITPSKPRERRPSMLAPWPSPGLFDFNRLIESLWNGENAMTEDLLGTRMDVAETDQSVEVKLDLPGVEAKNVDISIENNMLTVRGERREETEEHDKARQYHRVERRFGSFARSVMLPVSVNESEAVAEFSNGVLKIVLPKAESARSKKIKIK